MTTDTKALRALLDACVPGEWAASPSEHDLNLALRDAAPDLLDAADERDVLRVEVARLRGDARALRNRLVSEISCRYRNEGGAYEESIALAERDVITFEDAFHAATERLTGATK